MKTELLDYELPESRIAAYPAETRDQARLLVVSRDGLEHRTVADFADLVPSGSLVVVNDSRVLHARLLGSRRESKGRVEVFLLRRLSASPTSETWLALGRANRPLREGAVIEVGDLTVEVLRRNPDGTLDVELESALPIEEAIDRCGMVPLPPYIHRSPAALDVERYQTVFAARPGSVAAPTAGLHLTHDMIARLERRGVDIGKITLHVGLGTFRPVVAPDLDAHPMHEEEFSVSPELAERVRKARERGRPVIAVGTTVVRALESARDPERRGAVRPLRGATRLLIQPGYEFGVVDALLTNFHMPKSTLLALVFALAGRDRVLGAYAEAIRSGYRMLSYGDAMWIPEALA